MWETENYDNLVIDDKYDYCPVSNISNISTDGDGIKDYFEFINGADPTGADTDGDGLPDNIEINPTDGTQVSNPIGIEGEPPTMSNFHAEPVKAKRKFMDVEYDWYKIKISFTVFDSAGLDYAIIDVIGVDTKRFYFDADVDEAFVEVEFDPDEWKSLVTGYDVKITVYDDNGNGGTMKRHIKSVIEKLVEIIVGALVKIAKVITELASKAIDWIWDAIKKMLDGVTKPLWDAYQSWADNIKTVVKNIFAEHLAGENNPPSIDLATAIFGGAFYFGVLAFVLIIEVFLGLISVFAKIVLLGSDLIIAGLLHPIIRSLLLVAIITSLEVGVGIGFLTALFLILPKDHMFWQTGLALDIFALIAAVGSYILGVVLPGEGTDAKGLLMAFLGILLTIAAYQLEKFVIISLIFAILGLYLAIRGFLSTIETSDAIDAIGGPFAWTEEVIAFFATIYASISFGKAIGRLIFGGD